jgi:ER-bound oxygenase mpaB/B'/Rubber oxygenase, catalytic domain
MVNWKMGSFFSFEALNLRSSNEPFCRDGDVNYLQKNYNMNLFGDNIAFRLVEDGGRFISSDRLQSDYRQEGDDEVDNILSQMLIEGRPLNASEDLLVLAEVCFQRSLSDNEFARDSKADQLLADFYCHYTKQPEWYDSDQIERGRNVFLAYYGAIGLSLFYRSLAPGFSIPKIAAVLATTGYLSPPSNSRSVHNRLLDTGAFICAVLSETTTNSLRPVTGAGWKAALQVRILHAKVRHSLLNRKGKRKWDAESLGIPINQEDLSAVLLAFSMNSLFGCEIILGFPLPVSEQLDYLAFWRYLGWLLGVQCNETDNATISNDEKKGKLTRPIDPCGPGWIETSPNPLAHAVACSYSHALHLMKPDKSSVTMCHHILRAGRSLIDSRPDTRFYLTAALCRVFVGNELADCLELPVPTTLTQHIFVRFVSLSLLCFTRVYSWASLPGSPLRSSIISTHQWHCATLLERWQSGHILKMSQEKSILTNDTKTLLPTGGSGCPFAMVAPPIH